MEFFADRNLGSRIFPQIVWQSGTTLHRDTDHFAHDAPDHEWLPVVANRGWIILSRDAAIMRNRLERDAVMGSGAAEAALGAEQREEVRAILAAFRLKFIPEMLIDVAEIKAMLDGPEAARSSAFSVASRT